MPPLRHIIIVFILKVPSWGNSSERTFFLNRLGWQNLLKKFMYNFSILTEIIQTSLGTFTLFSKFQREIIGNKRHMGFTWQHKKDGHRRCHQSGTSGRCKTKANKLHDLRALAIMLLAQEHTHNSPQTSFIQQPWSSIHRIPGLSWCHLLSQLC